MRRLRHIEILMLGISLMLATIISPLYAQESVGEIQNEEGVTVEIVDGKEVFHEVRAEPSSEDANWPIIYSETTEKIDENTGEKYIEEIIIRESVDTHTLTEGAECPAKQGILATCNSYGQVSYQASNTGNNITAHLKHFAYRYCVAGAPGDCNVYKPYKVERWWTRPSTNYSVQGAVLQWGCGACFICSGGNWNYVYQSSAMTPQWNGLNSFVYITSIDWFEQLQASPYGGNVTAVSNSNQVNVDVPMPQ